MLLFHLILLLINLADPSSIKVTEVAKDLNSPVAMAVSDDGSGRIFVCEQKGFIRIIKNGAASEKPFLDLRKKMVSLNPIYDERGLLGFTFHPDFKKNKKFYVYYSAPSSNGDDNHKSILEEYKVSSTDSDLAESSGRIIMEIGEPESNHNGGQLAFGTDGYLYIGLGDGGGGGDKHGIIGNGQDKNSLLGKILRIDVNKKVPYSVPLDNPFIKETNSRPEIWAYGLRNPWRFSFDKLTSKLICADVGQNKYEELNIIEKGKNYGWRIMEGNHCYDPTPCTQKGLTLPVLEYDHSIGKSIIGGYVFRGQKKSPFYGKYIFGDWTGKVFYADLNEKTPVLHEVKLPKDFEDIYINSFGEDLHGNIYLLVNRKMGPKSMKGSLLKLSL